MTNWYGAIDQGTTSSRFIVYKLLDGLRPERISIARCPVKMDCPYPGWAQQDPLEILASVNECIVEVAEDIKRRFGMSLKDCLTAIGITNQRETTVAWNSSTGKPLSPAILWLDTRTKGILDDIAYTERHQKLTGLPLSTYFSGPKIRWLLEKGRLPIDSDLRVGTVDSWLLWNLLEGHPHLTDTTNASRTMLIDLSTRNWSLEMIKLMTGREDFPLSALPKILPSAAKYGIIGHGPAKGVPIMSCLGDQHAALLGHGCTEAGQAKLTYGTGCFLLRVRDMAESAAPGLVSTVGFDFGTSKYTAALEAPLSIGGSTLGWLRNLGILNDDEIDTLFSSENDLQNRIRSSAVLMIPGLAGTLTPSWNPDSTGALEGLTLHTDKKDIILAVLEAIAFSCLQALELTGRADPGKLKLDGGLTGCSTLMKIQATVLKSPLSISDDPEVTAVGAAIAAHQGATGKLMKIEQPSRTAAPWTDLLETYEGKYQRWLERINS